MYAHFGHTWLCLFWRSTWQYEGEDHHQVQQREVDVLEMALQVSDISLSVDSEDVEAVEDSVMEGGVGEENCGQKRKIGEETANSENVHGFQVQEGQMCQLCGLDLTMKMLQSASTLTRMTKARGR